MDPCSLDEGCGSVWIESNAFVEIRQGSVEITPRGIGLAAVVKDLSVPRISGDGFGVCGYLPIETRQTRTEAQGLHEILEALDKNLPLNGAAFQFKRTQSLSQLRRKL